MPGAERFKGEILVKPTSISKFYQMRRHQPPRNGRWLLCLQAGVPSPIRKGWIRCDIACGLACV